MFMAFFMLVTHPKLALKLNDFGIQVPLRDSRDERTWSELSNKHPTLQITPLEDFPIISAEDFCRVHRSNFVRDLFAGGSDLEKHLVQTYQLNQDEVDYRPEMAKKNLSELFQTLLLHASGTYLALQNCLLQKGGFSYHLGGGLHHAMSFGGRGFCLFNDAVIALEKLKDLKLIESAWVIDVDAHKGDGTAELASSRSWLKTMSLHMKEGWPLDHRDADPPDAPWLMASDLDIELSSGEEGAYLERLALGLKQMRDRFKKPDVVWVVGGADPYEDDELPSTQLMKLSLSELLQRDLMIYHFFKDWGVSQAWGMAGGYGEKTWKVYFQFLDNIYSKNS